MLIIPGTNKFACLFTIKSRNSRAARNVLRLLAFALTKNMYFSPRRRAIPLNPLSSRPCLPGLTACLSACLFLLLYFPSSTSPPLRRGIPLSDLPTYRDTVYSHGGSFTLQFGYFVRINI